jgi:phosphotransferase system HPr (HPr) family protein
MRFKSEITILANGKKCSAVSIMDMLTAGIRKGAEISVKAEGGWRQLLLEGSDSYNSRFLGML